MAKDTEITEILVISGLITISLVERGDGSVAISGRRLFYGLRPEIATEQDHRAIKKTITPMKGFKSFESAKATLAGIELHHMLIKGQYADAANMAIYEQFYALAA